MSDLALAAPAAFRLALMFGDDRRHVQEVEVLPGGTLTVDLGKTILDLVAQAEAHGYQLGRQKTLTDEARAELRAVLESQYARRDEPVAPQTLELPAGWADELARAFRNLPAPQVNVNVEDDGPVDSVVSFKRDPQGRITSAKIAEDQ